MVILGDFRPDLKQFMLDLIVSGDGDIPLFLRTGDGNETDKAVFGKILADFKKQVDFESIHVADSALYSQDNLLLIKDLNWITRVPLSIKAAQHLVTEITEKELVKSSENLGYSFVIKKDPLFFADAVYLKTSERIESMAMLMGLCLLVYKIGRSTTALKVI